MPDMKEPLPLISTISNVLTSNKMELGLALRLRGNSVADSEAWRLVNVNSEGSYGEENPDTFLRSVQPAFIDAKGQPVGTMCNIAIDSDHFRNRTPQPEAVINYPSPPFCPQPQPHQPIASAPLPASAVDTAPVSIGGNMEMESLDYWEALKEPWGLTWRL